MVLYKDLEKIFKNRKILEQLNHTAARYNKRLENEENNRLYKANIKALKRLIDTEV